MNDKRQPAIQDRPAQDRIAQDRPDQDAGAHVTDLLLDRLVDGELDRDEYAAVVRRLDADPQGWKRCALAFLEAQAWRRELSALAAEPATGPPLPAGHSGAAASQHRGLWLLAIAASWLLVFAIGRFSAPVAERGQPAAAPRPVAVGQPEQSEGMDGGAESAPSDLLAQTKQPWGNLQLQLANTVGWEGAEGWQGDQVEVPVYNLPGGSDQWMLSEHSEIPPAMVDAIQQMGNRVRRRQDVVPIPLDDGNQVLLPVEHVEIVPVSRQLYQ